MARRGEFVGWKTWVYVVGGFVGFVSGAILGAAGASALADKMVAIGSLHDTKGWQLALLIITGLATGTIGAGSVVVGLLSVDRAR